MLQMRDLKHAGYNGHDNTGGQQQIQTEVRPDPGVNCVVYLGYLLQKCIQFSKPLSMQTDRLQKASGLQKSKDS